MATQTSNLKAHSSKLTPSLPSAARGRAGEGPVESSHASRQGVILLVLLGMLALFTATAFAFVVIASHGNKTSKALQKVDRVVFAPDEDLQQIFDQVASGPKDDNRRSVLLTHSLLEDIYGANYVKGWIINHYTVAPNSAGTFRNPKNAIIHSGSNVKEEKLPLTLPPEQLPGTTTVTSSYQASIAGGQIIEFTAGYTIPNGGATGGLDVTTGAPIGSTTAANTITIPAWFGSEEANGTGNDNEAIEFQRRVGCVLTIKDSEFSRFYNLANKSTRIVGYRRETTYDGGGTLQIVYHRYQILPFDGIPVSDTVSFFANAGGDLSKTPRDKVDFIINGVPFSGTGVGYDDTNATNDAGYDNNNPDDYPYALLPNPTDPDYQQNVTFRSPNEGYDAPDYQNMLLAMEHWDGTAMVLTRSPSLHRPALAWYWLNRMVTVLQSAPYNLPDDTEAWRVLACPDYIPALRNTIVQLKRRCLLRPLPEDHPNFDGSNSRWPVYTVAQVSSMALAQLQIAAARSWGAVNLTPGLTYPWDMGSGEIVPWDVDNDGDGIPDSIWVDLGFPVRTLPDGRKYKPLAAIHCIDLGGRVNLNTAGTVEQLYDAYAQDPAATNYLGDNTVYAQTLNEGATPTVAPVLSRGQGAGTAEINPMPVLGDSINLYRKLLLGDATSQLDGRYGELDLRQYAPSGEYRWPAPGITPKNYSDYTSPSTLDSLAVARLFGYPSNYFYAVANGDALAYGTPMDLNGALLVGLDLFGQPIYSNLGGAIYKSSGYQSISSGWNFDAWLYTGLDSPYQLKLAPAAAQSAGLHSRVDNPFTVAELEPLLRRYDTDILRLPSRLRRLLGAGTSSLYRLNATTESWSVPVPSMGMTKELRDGWKLLGLGRPPQHLSDLIAARIAADSTKSLPSLHQVLTTDEAFRADLGNMLSHDALMGLLMDLNRPFGNGQDDDNNFVVDEPGETGADELARRQAYAKTLYLLMMALIDDDWYPNWDPVIARELEIIPAYTPGPVETAAARARAIAQWAVNVVDFRDADSVITPFEYDVYPFARLTATTVTPGELIATWDADGDLTTNNTGCDHVWGCERPELLITETLATHDRRQYDVDPDPTATDYVNAFRPEGSLFVELYNPWTNADGAPAELYRDYSSALHSGGVRLNQKSPSGNSPVWRLAVYDPDTTDEDIPTGLGYHDPHDSTDTNNSDPVRLVYFVQDTGATSTLPEIDNAQVTFSPAASALAPVGPHRYAVVGPGNAANGQYSPGATLLNSLPNASVSTARRIQLNPSSNPDDLDQVQVFSDGNADDLASLGVVDYSSSTGGAMQPPVAIMIDQARTNSTATLRDLRLSISEPVDGYAADADPSYNWTTGYATPLSAEDLARGTTDWGADTTVSPPDWHGPLAVPGTVSGVRYVHLQRLANPLIAHDPVTNPYRTIDSSPVDLTVFDSAMDIATHQSNNGSLHGYPQEGTADCIATRQRGETGSGTPNSSAFWTSLVLTEPEASGDLPYCKNTANKVLTTPNTGVPPRLSHSLGYLNDFFFVQSPLNTSHLSLPFAYAPYAGAPGTESGSPGSYSFVPEPFPWFTWLNRPFTNPGEVTLAPAVDSARLLLSVENEQTVAGLEAYSAGRESFAQTLPFFTAIDSDTPKDTGRLRGFTTTPADSVPALAPHFYRLLDYVHVPSRFVDSQTRGNPTFMNATYMTTNGEDHAFCYPSNFIPTWREPGKINLNTVYGYDVSGGTDSLVWQALSNDYDDKMPTWDDFLKTRRAFPVSTAAAVPDHYGFEDVSSPDPPLPTRMANPFRSFAGVQLVPPVPGRDPGGANPPYLTGLIQQGVNATLLRAAVTGTNYTDAIETRNPLFTNNVTTAYADTRKTPYFKHQSLQRLSNLVTNRSNVYAVWITVGYFEVQPVPGFTTSEDYIYPEGYTLGQELGIDTGDVTRRRAFYIFDRSIPVGFIPGENLNTEKAVLLKRFIE